MDFTPKQKAWILLITIVIGTGAVVFVTSYSGGAKWWISLILAMGTGATNVYHALNKSPVQSESPKNQNQPS